MSSGREEGEIDSEEDGLRKRICELEEQNAIYEKHRGFKDCYLGRNAYVYEFNEHNDINAIQRAGQVPTDVSSISSGEFPSPKKRKHKKNKKAKCKAQARRSSRCSHQRHKRCKNQLHHHGAKRHHHHSHRENVVLNPYYEKHDIETISLDSTDMSTYEQDNYSIAAMEIESPDESFDTTLPLSREELRIALGRSTADRKSNGCSLKDRLNPQKFNPLENVVERETKVQKFEKSAGESEDVGNVVEIDSDNSISLEEQELRLIALRSAYMRKHVTRQKRNAEIAYSPSDFHDLVVESISVADSEIEELEGDMEISPASSPRLLLSPIRCDDEQNSNLSLETVENHNDNKPIDMDIASSDSEHEDTGGSNVVDAASGLELYSMHDIPLPTDAPIKPADLPPIAYDYANPNTALNSYELFVPAMNYGTPVEMTQAIMALPAIPPPPPTLLNTSAVMPPLQFTPTASADLRESFGVSVMVDAGSLNDPNLYESKECQSPRSPFATLQQEQQEAMKSEYCNEEGSAVTDVASPKSAIMINTKNDTQEQSDKDSDEEEAEALRALLLAQRQGANKATRVKAPQIVRNHSPASRNSKEMDENITPSIPSPFHLPSLSLPTDSIDTNRKPTECILKEAVRRLKVKKSIAVENVQNEFWPEEVPLPRLKIRSFARCQEFDEERTSSNDSTDRNKYQQQQEDCLKSLELDASKSASQIFGSQSSCLEDSMAAHSNKRRFESDASVGGRTLRRIELAQCAAENTCSKQPAEDMNCLVVKKPLVQNEYGKQPKKFKRATTMVEHVEQMNQCAKKLNMANGDSECGGEKQSVQEVQTAKERNSNASGEKENKEVPTESVLNGNDGPANTVAKVKANLKLVSKLAKVGEKRKISTLEITAQSPALSSAVKKQSIGKAATVKQPVTKTPAALPPKATKQVKIVKPNKVINKIAARGTETSTQNKTSDVAAMPSRLLTAATLPNIRVNKLIIRVYAGESSSEEEEVLRQATLEQSICLTTTRAATPDALTAVLNDNIYLNDKSATLPNLQQQQQHADLPNSPNAAAPIDNNNGDVSNGSLVSDVVPAHESSEAFEKKLEIFLKSMRSKIQSKSDNSIQHPRVRKISASHKQTGTPTAVRSLPIASQEEYKRLVNRMKILEKQKQLKKMQKCLLEDAEKYSKSKSDNAAQLHEDNTKVSETACGTSHAAPINCNPETVAGNESVKPKQANADEHSNKFTSLKNISSSPGQVFTTRDEAALNERLRSCEVIFTNISKNIVTRLDKSLQLVNDAKIAKITKMRHEQRLRELRLEMEQTQRKMKEEQVKMSRIYPEICANNELITKLKQKRTRALDMAMKLGKTIKGDEYRLNNNLKNEITLKTKGLATHIKLVNSISYSDLDKLDKEVLETTKVQQSANNTKATTNNPKSSKETVVGNTQENIECAIISTAQTNNANAEEASAQSTKSANKSLDVCENVIDDNLVMLTVKAPESTASENCDISIQASSTITKKEGEKEKEAINAGPDSVEDMPAPCGDGKEVQHLVDGQQQENTIKEDDNLKRAMDETKRNRSLLDYVSPLVHLKSESGKWNPNDIICPYELMGQCEDKECSYRHLTT